MKQSTIKKYLAILQNAKNSNKSLKEFCVENNLSYNSVANTIRAIKNHNKEETEDIKLLSSLYSQVSKSKEKQIHFKKGVEKVETDDKAEVEYIRDDSGKIQYYKYQIYRRDKAPLLGKLTREEMNTIHRLYSYYGDSLTQRVISRHFVDLSLIDFKRILRAFNITKASAPFAPHMIEECSEQELRNIQLREKENSFLRKAEEDQIKNNEKLLKKYALENIELKKKLSNISDISISLSDQIKPTVIEKIPKQNKNINLYISDIHLGACVTSGSLYHENDSYGFDEAKRRLGRALGQLITIGEFDTVNVVLLGDNIDCSGFFGKTSRLDHNMPENMDPREQANKFIELMMWFIETLASKANKICSNIRVYSVPCGNHGGNFEYLCNKALLNCIKGRFPEITTTLWEEFFGVFEQNNETFVCCHGKDSQYMRKGLPLNLDDKSKIMIYEWLHSKNINVDNVHVIKGDLHSNNIDSCLRFDYRNVLSLFGASDYTNYNFSKNSYGLSYDLFIGDNLVRGSFENMQTEILRRFQIWFQ